jgi:hypothetical protein
VGPRYWWGRRSADADLEVQVVLRRTVDAGEDACSILISTRRHVVRIGDVSGARLSPPLQLV